MLAALDRLGTIAAVADHLHLTAPGISMQLRSLEREIGLPLTERRGRRLVLTPAGRRLASHAHDVLNRLTLAEHELDALRRGESGSYSVAAFPSAARTIVAELWGELASAGEGPVLRLTTLEPEAALAAVAKGGADLAVVHSYSNVPRDIPDAVITTPLMTEPVWIAIRADDPAVNERIDLADLHGNSWVAPATDLTCFTMMERACGIAGFRPRVVAESSDFDVLLALVSAGVGVALVPDLAVASLPENVILVAPAAPIARHVHCARRASQSTDPGLNGLIRRLEARAHARARPTELG